MNVVAINAPVPKFPSSWSEEFEVEEYLNKIQHKADKAKKKAEEKMKVKLARVRVSNDEHKKKWKDHEEGKKKAEEKAEADWKAVEKAKAWGKAAFCEYWVFYPGIQKLTVPEAGGIFAVHNYLYILLSHHLHCTCFLVEIPKLQGPTILCSQQSWGWALAGTTTILESHVYAQVNVGDT